MIFCMIFDVTTPVSKYLQTTDLDYVQAWHQINSMLEQLRNLSVGGFQTVFECSKKFVNVMNKGLDDYDIYIEDELPVQRRSKSKSCVNDVVKNFEIINYNVILDKIIMTIEKRFAQHEEFYKNVECFDPRRFEKISKDGLPNDSLVKICEYTRTNEEEVRDELLSFARLFHSLSQKSREKINDKKKVVLENCDEDFYSENDESASVENKHIENCDRCVSCVYRLIVDYRMYSLEYENLFKIYKFLLTLPMTQVTCERSFSKLKIIKNRLRSTMNNENLEACMLMACENDILQGIDEFIIIEKLCKSSSEYDRLLR